MLLLSFYSKKENTIRSTCYIVLVCIFFPKWFSGEHPKNWLFRYSGDHPKIWLVKGDIEVHPTLRRWRRSFGTFAKRFSGEHPKNWHVKRYIEVLPPLWGWRRSLGTFTKRYSDIYNKSLHYIKKKDCHLCLIVSKNGSVTRANIQGTVGFGLESPIFPREGGPRGQWWSHGQPSNHIAALALSPPGENIGAPNCAYASLGYVGAAA